MPPFQSRSGHLQPNGRQVSSGRASRGKTKPPQLRSTSSLTSSSLPDVNASAASTTLPERTERRLRDYSVASPEPESSPAPGSISARPGPPSSCAPSSVSERQEQSLDSLADAFLAKLQSKGFSGAANGIDASTAKDLLTGFASVAFGEGGKQSPAPQQPTAESDWESEAEDGPQRPTVRKAAKVPLKSADSASQLHREPRIAQSKKEDVNGKVDASSNAVQTGRQPKPKSKQFSRPAVPHDIEDGGSSVTSERSRDPLEQANRFSQQQWTESMAKAHISGKYFYSEDGPKADGIEPWSEDVEDRCPPESSTKLDSGAPPAIAPPPWLVLHAVVCPDSRGAATFFDEPMLVKNDWDYQSNHRMHWDARNRVSPARLRELRATAGPFIITREYDCSLIRRKNRYDDDDEYASDESSAASSITYHRTKSRERSVDSYRNRDRSPVSESEPDTRRRGHRNTRFLQSSDAQSTVQESVYVVSRPLRGTIVQLLERHQWLKAYDEMADMRKHRLSAPYYFFYHFENEMKLFGEELAEAMPDDEGEYQLLLRYLAEQTRPSHAEINATFQSKKVKAHMMPYLFKPGGILVTVEDDEPVGRAQTSVLSTYNGQVLSAAASEPGQTIDFQLGIRHYSFDGQYRLHDDETSINFHTREGEPQSIRNLPIYPLKFAPRKTKTLLVSRGEKFAKYCCKHYVTYTEKEVKKRRMANRSHDEDLLEGYQTQVRYMIDGEAYRMIHEDDGSGSSRRAAPVVDPEPDNKDFLCQLPAVVKGFHIVNKKWVPLLVENVEPIIWNKAAFENLAAPDDTKMLITALITNKIKSTESMDFVQGKGTGLIVLLHGGPGTGKTLTAESVAEIAEKPLYRVSCGDIGTDARQVEDYLTSVFYLGRRWESVVLLDEADVFLEERSLDNLQRNALVSVFLRMIEYFDGILVLTSNRVGTFDEAFKSRIQLSLHYENLNAEQREKIWSSFIARLKDLKEDMEPSIEKKVKDLAAYPMNGRQIRNAITSARQVSRFKGEKLSFAILQSVIGVGQRFETYLEEVRGHSSEEWARFEKQR